MQKKSFDITGRKSTQEPTSSSEPAIERFIAASDPQTTMTVQIPTRLKRALKQKALEQDTTIKNLLIQILETHLAENK